MEHPPILPSCGVHVKYGYLQIALCGHVLCSGVIWERKIIAAVARCAWLDEAARLDDLNLDFEIMAARKCAIENAEAWRVWGLVK